MDELTLQFIQRLLRMKGRILGAMAVGALALGAILHGERLPESAALLTVLAVWAVVAWAATDRTRPSMQPILSAPSARRTWFSAYLLAGSLTAAAICFIFLLAQGIRPALGAAMYALAYGWMLSAIGLLVVLRSVHPYEAVCFGGVIAVVAALTAFGEGAAAWHPFTPFKFGLLRALYIAGEPGGPGGIMALRLEGILLPLLLAVASWRWGLRSLDRLETLPEGGA